YCQGRVKLEEAKVLDKKGDEEESGARYRSASNDFRELMSRAQTDQIRVELEALTLFSEARCRMKDAETRASPEMYAEAADLFARAEKVTQARTFRHDALRRLDRARQEKELLLTPIEALSENPALTRVPGTPDSLIRGQPGSLESFEDAKVVGNLGVVGKDFNVGSDLTVELEVANVGRSAARLIKLENVVVEGIQLDKRRI